MNISNTVMKCTSTVEKHVFAYVIDDVDCFEGSEILRHTKGNAIAYLYSYYKRY